MKIKLLKKNFGNAENVKKFVSNGFKVYLEKNYGAHLDIDDKKFLEMERSFLTTKNKLKKLWHSSQLNLPDEKDLKNLSPNKNFIGVLIQQKIRSYFKTWE